MPWPIYADAVVAFFEAAGQECWADHRYIPSDAGEMLQSEAVIAGASLAQIRTMLTWCVRGERFCDGHWGAVFGDGKVYALLRRLDELRREAPDP